MPFFIFEIMVCWVGWFSVLSGWLVRFVDWLVGLVGWLGWLVGWLVGWFVGFEDSLKIDDTSTAADSNCYTHMISFVLSRMHQTDKSENLSFCS